MDNPGAYDLAIAEMQFINDAESRFSGSLSGLEREEYARHVKEFNRLMSSWCNAFSARCNLEAEPYVAHIRDEIVRVVGERRYWTDRKVKHAMYDCPPMVIKVPTVKR